MDWLQYFLVIMFSKFISSSSFIARAAIKHRIAVPAYRFRAVAFSSISRRASPSSLRDRRESWESQDNYDWDSYEAEFPLNQPKYEVGQEVSVEVIRFTPMGVCVSIKEDGMDAAQGFIMGTQIDLAGRTVAVGEVLDAYIARILDDGKIDINIRPIGIDRIHVVARYIHKALLRSATGSLPVGEKSIPEVIESHFNGISKGDFKRALGVLFKQGLCQPGPDAISLIRSPAQTASQPAHKPFSLTPEQEEALPLALKKLNSKSFLKFTSMKTFYVCSLPLSATNADVADHVRKVLSTDPTFALRDNNGMPVNLNTASTATATATAAGTAAATNAAGAAAAAAPVVNTPRKQVLLPLAVRLNRDEGGLFKGSAHVDIPFQGDPSIDKGAMVVQLLNRSLMGSKSILCKESMNYEDWKIERPVMPPAFVHKNVQQLHYKQRLQFAAEKKEEVKEVKTGYSGGNRSSRDSANGGARSSPASKASGGK